MSMSRVYLPSIRGDAITGEGQASPVTAFMAAWLAALGTKAQDMVQDTRLVAAAQKHATWLAANAVTANRHIGENGSTANERARAESYRLPDWYPVVGNNIESVGECYDGPERALQLLVDSPPHRAHLLREGWFAGHCVVGVGNAAHYWVVVSAPVEA